MLALAVLFGYPQRVDSLLSWINRDDDRGHDALLHRLFERVGKTFAGKTLIHPQPYSTLLETLDLRGAEQRHHLSLYLKHWYGGLQGCYWHGRHRRARGDHLGYYVCVERMVGEHPFMHNTPFPKIENEVVHWQLSRTFTPSS